MALTQRWLLALSGAADDFRKLACCGVGPRSYVLSFLPTRLQPKRFALLVCDPNCARGLRDSGQLEYGRKLSFTQAREQYDLAVWEFQCVAMGIGKAALRVTETGDLLSQPLVRKEGEYRIALDFVVEREFCTWQETYRNV